MADQTGAPRKAVTKKTASTKKASTAKKTAPTKKASTAKKTAPTKRASTAKTSTPAKRAAARQPAKKQVSSTTLTAERVEEIVRAAADRAAAEAVAPVSQRLEALEKQVGKARTSVDKLAKRAKKSEASTGKDKKKSKKKRKKS